MLNDFERRLCRTIFESIILNSQPRNSLCIRQQKCLLHISRGEETEAPVYYVFLAKGRKVRINLTRDGSGKKSRDTLLSDNYIFLARNNCSLPRLPDLSPSISHNQPERRYVPPCCGCFTCFAKFRPQTFHLSLCASFGGEERNERGAARPPLFEAIGRNFVHRSGSGAPWLVNKIGEKFARRRIDATNPRSRVGIKSEGKKVEGPRCSLDELSLTPVN